MPCAFLHKHMQYMVKRALAELSGAGVCIAAGAGETTGTLGAVGEVGQVGAWPTAGALAKTMPVAILPAAAASTAGAEAGAVQHPNTSLA